MNITATFSDPTGRFQAQSDLLIQNAIKGLEFWSPALAESSASIEIAFHLVGDYANRGGGRSMSSITIGQNGPLTISDHGAVYELRTGNDANGDLPDIEVFFDANFLAQHYWINPLDGSHTPTGMNDLVQVIAHEMGHALGINGFRDYASAQLSGDYASPFDALVHLVDGLPYFTGPAAMASFGGPVPLTLGNLYHVGTEGHSHGSLSTDLMNGIVFSYDNDYAISPLDIAVLSDIGLPTILSDKLMGSALADRMNGGAGDDLIQSKAGADTVLGGVGADTLDGGGDNDLLRGGRGDDSINGSDGADWIAGDRGDDVLIGGAGADIFYAFADSDRDVIRDFNFYEGDRIQLDYGTPFAVDQVGADVVLTIADTAHIVLTGVDLGSLQSGWLFEA